MGLFLKRRDSRVEQITSLVVREGITITVITYCCVSTCFLSVEITSEQAVPSVVAQRIIVKFLTNENVKPAKIVKRLRAELGDEKLLRTQVYYRCRSFRTEAENRRRLHLLQGKLWPRRLSHRFSDRTTNHQRNLLFEAS
jgi:hypothetical protein